MSLIFLDTEFTNLTNGSELISIALIDDQGNGFYAVRDDFNHENCSGFVRENVLPQLEIYPSMESQFTSVHGTYFSVAERVKNWMEQYNIADNEVTIITDIAFYDWKFFYELPCYENGLPDYISPFPIDLNSMLLARLGTTNVDRVELSKVPPTIHRMKQHHALYDALLLKACYSKIMNLEHE